MVIGMLLCFALVTVAFQYLARYVIWYRLTKDRLTVVVVGIPWFWVDLDSITDIYRIRWRDLMHPLVMFGVPHGLRNRLNNNVLITRKSGFFRYLVVTPSDPDLFIKSVNGRQALVHC